MNARRRPYPPAGSTLRVPADLWSAALEVLRRYGEQDASEALVYLTGVALDDESVVTALYELGHRPQGGRVVVTREETRWLVRTLRERDEKLLAQVHSHRGAAGHSHGDDEHATSFHDGFISIVVPAFARDVRHVKECSVNECVTTRFRALPATEAERRVALFDRHVQRQDYYQLDEEVRWWDRCVQRLRSTARKLRSMVTR